MLYIIQLDNSGYVAHDNQSGWFVTSEKEKACKLGKFWIKKIMDTFDKNLEEVGYIHINGYFKPTNYTTNITEFHSNEVAHKYFQPSFFVFFEEEKMVLPLQ